MVLYLHKLRAFKKERLTKKVKKINLYILWIILFTKTKEIKVEITIPYYVKYLQFVIKIIKSRWLKRKPQVPIFFLKECTERHPERSLFSFKMRQIPRKLIKLMTKNSVCFIQLFHWIAVIELLLSSVVP